MNLNYRNSSPAWVVMSLLLCGVNAAASSVSTLTILC